MADCNYSGLVAPGIGVGAGKFLGVRKIFAQFPQVFGQLFAQIFPPTHITDALFWDDL